MYVCLYKSFSFNSLTESTLCTYIRQQKGKFDSTQYKKKYTLFALELLSININYLSTGSIFLNIIFVALVSNANETSILYKKSFLFLILCTG